MKNLKKSHSKNFSKNLPYEKNRKTIVTIFQKICYMKNLKKNHSYNFLKNVLYEKFEKT